VPESGMPKIDLVVGLARALGWPVEAVVDHLMEPADAPSPRLLEPSQRDFRTLSAASHRHREDGDRIEAVRLAVLARQAATDPNERALAAVAEAAAHEASGAYADSARCLREATSSSDLPLDLRLACEARLAAVLSLQGQGTMAVGLAASVLRSATGAAGSLFLRVARALAHAAQVHAIRTSIPIVDFASWRKVARNARTDCAAASALLRGLATERGLAETGGVAFVHLVESAARELDAVADPRRASDATSALLELAVVPAGPAQPPGEREAWAAIALARTARRFLPEGPELRGALEMASSTLRACAVGRSHWHFAYHHLEIDRGRRKLLPRHLAPARALDEVEAKLLAGVLGQIPSARSHAAAYFEMYGKGAPMLPGLRKPAEREKPGT